MKFDKLPLKDPQTFAKFVREAEESSDTKRRQITQMFLTLNHGAQEMDDRMNFIAALLTEAANEEGKTYRNLQDLPLRRWPRVLQALDHYQTRFKQMQARIAEDTAHDERMKLSALDGSKLAAARVRAAGMTSADMTTMLIRFRSNAHGNGGDRVHRRHFLDQLYERLGYSRFKNIPVKFWGDIILALEEYEVHERERLFRETERKNARDEFTRRVSEFLTPDFMGAVRVERKAFLRNLRHELGYDDGDELAAHHFGTVLRAMDLHVKEQEAKKILRAEPASIYAFVPAVEIPLSVVDGQPLGDGIPVKFDADAVPLAARRAASFIRPSLITYGELCAALCLTPKQMAGLQAIIKPKEGTTMTEGTTASRDKHTLDSLARSLGRCYERATVQINEISEQLRRDTDQLVKEAKEDGLSESMINAIHSVAIRDGVLKTIKGI